MANETIGMVRCPIAGDLAEVRRDKRHKLYYVGAAGMIKPNLPTGQKWLEKHADFSVNVTDDEEQITIEDFVTEQEREQAEVKKSGLAALFTWGDE